MEDYNDKLNEMIIDRLEERKYKIERINEIEMPRRLSIVRPLAGVAIAACILGAIFISPWNKGNPIEKETMRASTVNVDSLVNNGDYDAALRIIVTNIAKSDSTIKVLKNEAKLKKDEELDYLIQAEQMNIDDLKEKEQEIEILKNKTQ